MNILCGSPPRHESRCRAKTGRIGSPLLLAVGMKLFRQIHAILVLASVIGCATAEIEGPPRPVASEVSSIRVVRIAPPAVVASQDAPERIRSIVSSYSFSQDGWMAAHDRVFNPYYRIDFLKGSEILAVYWLGSNADPPQFPCYSLCSGSWIAPSTDTGRLDDTRYKGLADTVNFNLFRDLGL